VVWVCVRVGGGVGGGARMYFDMLDMYSLLLVFSHSIRGSLHITHACSP
jgi:hypothetical protein